MNPPRAPSAPAREIFSPELDILEATRERLARPAYAEQIAEGLMADLEFASQAIHAVINRAEPLPDFSDMAKNSGMEEDQNFRRLH